MSRSGSQPNRALPNGTPAARPDDCVKAIGTSMRRRILRSLHIHDEARSPIELAREFQMPVGHVSYHVTVLKECGALALTDTERKRGAVEHFYASTIASNDQITQLLEDTRANDEAAGA